MASVSLFTPTFEYAGGVERYIINLSEGLIRRGHNVEIVTGNPEGPFAAEIPDDATIHRISIPNIPGIGVFSAVIPLISYFRRRNPDNFISAMNQVNIPSIIAHSISGSDTNLIISDHNNPKILISDKNPEQVKDIFIYKLARYLYPLADQIIGVSDGVSDDLAEVANLNRDRIKSIYNPVVNDDIKKRASESLDHWMFNDDVPVILGAKPEPQKNISLLVQAFADLREEMEAYLLIVGEGEQKSQIKQLISDLGIEDSTEVLGFVEDIYPYLGKSDVFASASNWEGLPTIHIEALACETTVVSTDCPSGPNEILQNGEYGYLVPPNNSQELSQALRKAIQSPISQEKMRERAHDFSIGRAAAKYESLLE